MNRKLTASLMVAMLSLGCGGVVIAQSRAASGETFDIRGFKQGMTIEEARSVAASTGSDWKETPIPGSTARNFTLIKQKKAVVSATFCYGSLTVIDNFLSDGSLLVYARHVEGIARNSAFTVQSTKLETLPLYDGGEIAVLRQRLVNKTARYSIEASLYQNSGFSDTTATISYKENGAGCGL